MSPSSILGQQMAKRVDKTMSEINRLRQFEAGHVATEDLCLQPATLQLSLSPRDARFIQVEGSNVVAAFRKFNNLAAATAANLKDSRCSRFQIARSGRLNKVGLERRFIAESQIPIARSIVAIR